MMLTKRRVYEIVEIGDPKDPVARMFGYCLISLILVNMLLLILGTMQSVYALAPWFFRVSEGVTVTLFLAEYILRIWSSTADPKYGAPLTGRVRFALSPLVLIDLIAILPTLIAWVLGLLFGLNILNLSFLRAVRLAARVGKLSRYSSGVRTLSRVIRQKREELITVVFVLMVLLLVASSFMYYAERFAQPEKFSSIPAAMWWSIITLTTVGYGDVFPVTPLGRAIAGAIAILGIGLFALPAGILGSGFLEELQNRRIPPIHRCPYCGHEIP